VQRLADDAGIGGLIGAEERLAGDLESEPHHVGVDVAGSAIVPRFEHLGSRGHHDAAVFGEAGRLKGGGNELSLTAPEIALGGDQPITQHRLVHPQSEVFDEVLRFLNEHLFDQARAVEKQDGPVNDAEPHDVAVGSCAVGEELEAADAEVGEVAGE